MNTTAYTKPMACLLGDAPLAPASTSASAPCASGTDADALLASTQASAPSADALLTSASTSAPNADALLASASTSAPSADAPTLGVQSSSSSWCSAPCLLARLLLLSRSGWMTLMAIGLSLSGMGMLLVALWLPPRGSIEPSVLVAYGEVMTFVGALLGISYVRR